MKICSSTSNFVIHAFLGESSCSAGSFASYPSGAAGEPCDQPDVIIIITIVYEIDTSCR